MFVCRFHAEMGGYSYWYWQTNEESDGTRVNPHYVLKDKSGQGREKERVAVIRSKE